MELEELKQRLRKKYEECDRYREELYTALQNSTRVEKLFPENPDDAFCSVFYREQQINSIDELDDAIVKEAIKRATAP